MENLTSLLRQNQIHLWRFNLETPPNDWQANGRHLLSEDEDQRAVKFKRGMDDYINTRIFMRRVLSQYVEKGPKTIEFDLNPHGKPFLRQSDIQFNLSHSRQWAVLAVGINCELGIDVESISDGRSTLNIAQHYFHADEIEELEKLQTVDDQQDYFFRLWTLKESFLKALGTGISTGLDKVNFNIKDREKIAAKFSPDLKLENEQNWQFFQCELNEASTKNWCAVSVNSATTAQIIWK